MTSPFRTTGQLGPDLHQTVTPGSVWYDNPDMVSPVVGTKETGDDGHEYVWVKASAAIASGATIVVTEPAFTAATGAGSFTAPATAIASGDYFWARRTAI